MYVCGMFYIVNLETFNFRCNISFTHPLHGGFVEILPLVMKFSLGKYHPSDDISLGANLLGEIPSLGVIFRRIPFPPGL